MTAHFLVVDDNAVNRTLLKVLLEKQGYVVSVASGGSEAVSCVQDGAFDMVFMDINMPDIDGVEATLRIRDLGTAQSQMPIIAVTASAEDGVWDRAHAAGMNGRLEKPLALPELNREIAKWLNKFE